MDLSLTNAWKRSARISISPATIGRSLALASARRRRRTTASTRAMSSSGWQGFESQSSAPRRRPRTRWATVDCPVQTTTPSPGSPVHSRSRYSHAAGPRTARSTTTALSRIATIVSTGTALASTRCSQPRRSSRLVRTWRKPESVSMTAIRSGAWPAEDIGGSGVGTAAVSVMARRV